MAIPDEYKIKEIVRKTDNIIVCKAEHQIHGVVAIYMPDDALSPETAATVKRNLYRSGIQMRSISQLFLPFVTKILEVSQNPNEPYIVTEYSRYDVEKLINERVKLKPKRIYQIFSQVLQAIKSLLEEGWQIDCLNPSQIKLSNIHEGNATFTALPSTRSQTTFTKTISASKRGGLNDTVTLETEKSFEDGVVEKTQTLKDDIATDPTITLRQTFEDDIIEKTQTLKDDNTIESSQSGIKPTVTLPQNGDTFADKKSLRVIQRNIYILGGQIYQLLFGEKYHLSDSNAIANIRKLRAKWQTVLDRALSPNLEDCYESYESMLRDIERALSRNKRIAIAVAPLIVLLLVVGGLFGYRQYRRYKIKTSEAGQAIENFLDIVDKTESEFPEPSSALQKSDDDSILQPFDEITTTPVKEK